MKNRRDGSYKGGQQRVLVMGGMGFIGSHLSRLLLHEGYSVRIFDKLFGSRSLIADIERKIEIDEGDADRPEDILRALRDIDIAVDFIHSTVPGVSMKDPAYDVQSNVVSHAAWLSQLNKTKLRRIIYVSSGGTVYGIPRENPLREDHPTEPICSYGITKLAVEKYIAMYSDIYGIDYRICRPANVYGEGQHLHVGQGVIGVFLEQCLKKQSIEIWGDGTVSRDYNYVEDMVRGVVELIQHNGEGRIFNISSGRGYSLNDIITIIRDDLKIPVHVNYLSARGFDVPVNILDSSRLMRETGWKPQIDLMTGMRRVYDYLKTLLKV